MLRMGTGAEGRPREAREGWGGPRSAMHYSHAGCNCATSNCWSSRAPCILNGSPHIQTPSTQAYAQHWHPHAHDHAD
eukprot:3177257-Alexandrium_andersonii.AAC.1